MTKVLFRTWVCTALLVSNQGLARTRKTHSHSKARMTSLSYARWIASLIVFAQFQVARTFLQDAIRNSYSMKAMLLSISKSNNPNYANSPEWTLSEDWALLDTVPKFTVGDNIHARTFWTQLSAATPELSSFREVDLRQRYGTLLNTNHNCGTNRSDGSVPTSTLQHQPSSVCLGSPHVLHDWVISDDPFYSYNGQSNTNKVSLPMIRGTLEDRTIWFQIQTVGTLDTWSSGSFFVAPRTNMFEAAVPGGFVEAVGGRVYELGTPAAATSDDPRGKSVTTKTGMVRTIVPTTGIAVHEEITLPSRPFSWASAATATVSALVASSILSAAIGYGSGLGIASIEGRESSLRSASSLPPTTVIMVHKQGSSMGSASVPRSATVAAQRAQTEARILQEQRLLNSISERLERDQIELQLLKQEEGAVGYIAP